MEHICQKTLPYAPWSQPATRRLPGVQPLDDPRGWLVQDDAYDAQMALRAHLLDTRRGDVVAETPGAGPAVAELYHMVLDWLAGAAGFTLDATTCHCPDGRRVALNPDDPLGTLAQLVQEDLCLLERQGDEHVLTAAVLCFPASWTLAEKIGRPLTRIHVPVAPYDDAMAGRVQRLFDNLRTGAPLWRQNALLYARPDLFQPAPEAKPRVVPAARPTFLRSERQCLLRLPETGAILFSIHTWVVPFADLSPEQTALLADHPIHYAGRST